MFPVRPAQPLRRDQRSRREVRRSRLGPAADRYFVPARMESVPQAAASLLGGLIVATQGMPLACLCPFACSARSYIGVPTKKRFGRGLIFKECDFGTSPNELEYRCGHDG